MAKGKKGGSQLTLVLSGTASVDGSVALRVQGVQKTVRGKKQCLAAPKHKVKGQKSCTRLVHKADVSLGILPGGSSTRPFTGILGGHKLAPGKYQLMLGVLDNSSGAVLPFTIKR